MRTFRGEFRGAVTGLLGVAAFSLLGQGLTVPGPLRPGEGLVLCAGEAPPHSYGEARRLTPLGGLACLPWLKLMGAEWGSRDLRFRCTGGTEPFPCGGAKGHGQVDLEQAVSRGCDRAFLAWAAESLADWRSTFGEGATRLQLLEAFGPFLGSRLPPGQGIPVLSPAWVGRGDLLQSSPAALAQWLQDPLQMDVLSMLERYGSGYFSEIKFLLGREGWWALAATAPAGRGDAGTWAWVVAGQGDLRVVFRRPGGRGEREDLARLRGLLGVR